MRISDWSSDVCSSDLVEAEANFSHAEVVGKVQKGVFQSRLGTSSTRTFFRLEAAGDQQRAVGELQVGRNGLAGANGRGLVFAQAVHQAAASSEERRVGKEWVSTCRSGVLP